MTSMCAHLIERGLQTPMALTHDEHGRVGYMCAVCVANCVLYQIKHKGLTVAEVVDSIYFDRCEHSPRPGACSICQLGVASYLGYVASCLRFTDKFRADMLTAVRKEINRQIGKTHNEAAA